MQRCIGAAARERAGRAPRTGRAAPGAGHSRRAGTAPGPPNRHRPGIPRGGIRGGGPPCGAELGNDPPGRRRRTGAQRHARSPGSTAGAARPPLLPPAAAGPGGPREQGMARSRGPAGPEAPSPRYTMGAEEQEGTGGSPRGRARAPAAARRQAGPAPGRRASAGRFRPHGRGRHSTTPPLPAFPPPASRPPSPAAAARYASPRLRPGPLGRAGPGGGGGARRPPPERRGGAWRGGGREGRWAAGPGGAEGRAAVAEKGREGGAGFKGAARSYRSRRRRRAATLPGSHHTDNYQRRPPPSRDEGAGAGPARLHPRDARERVGQGALFWWHRRVTRRGAPRSRESGGRSPVHVVGVRSGFGGRHVVRPRAGPGMAGAGSNWLSGVNVVLVMAYGSLVRRAGVGRPGGRAWASRVCGAGSGVSVGPL